ncbi:MAG: hypothetical protein IT210_00055 [Armatimonadetes bacterium]|nr:hypothetical protein [Armatimonadota bacterium]
MRSTKKEVQVDRQELIRRIEDARDLLREIRSRYAHVERYPEMPYSLFFGGGEEDALIDRQIAQMRAEAVAEAQAIDTTLRILDDLRQLTIGEQPPG